VCRLAYALVEHVHQFFSSPELQEVVSHRYHSLWCGKVQVLWKEVWYADVVSRYVHEHVIDEWRIDELAQHGQNDVDGFLVHAGYHMVDVVSYRASFNGIRHHAILHLREGYYYEEVHAFTFISKTRMKLGKTLGEGSYGTVRLQDGMAIKKFDRLRYMTQEYTMLSYLSDCNYIVKTLGANFKTLEIHMEAYDCSLRQFIDDDLLTDENRLIILRDILRGLVELHDRSLTHGDLKPGNILVRKPTANNDIKVVIADCGFVSIAKYAKIERTSPAYKDIVLERSCSHDIYSFGICFLEIMAGKKITSKKITYEDLMALLKTGVQNRYHRSLIISMVHKDKSKRPTSRDLLYTLFMEEPDTWYVKPFVTYDMNPSLVEITERIKTLMYNISMNYQIKRCRRTYNATLSFVNFYDLSARDLRVYSVAAMMIASYAFGTLALSPDKALQICNGNTKTYEYEDILVALQRLIEDPEFLNILLCP
jgi:serine/threonine protein kinase